ncbi:MAG TPA: hypothetical protein VFC19_15235 [Candidatus Limnocylindrales bacterium]|nr:hypothetical protein [Candidatus Limnocylindrales bacterium]
MDIIARWRPLVISVLTVVAVCLGGFPAPASAGPSQSDDPARVARQRLQDPASLVRTNWRAVLASGLDRLPELRTTVSVTEPLRGLVLAGSLRLPETVVLAADTTIVARDLVLTGPRVTIEGQGHSLALLTIDGVQTAGLGTGPAPTTTHTRQTLTTIVINTSGTQGSAGYDGPNGFFGYDGFDGSDGQPYPAGCYFPNGGRGQNGENGGNGVDGGDGHSGTDAGSITLDIPEGADATYELIAKGGKGGDGGRGGDGAEGGRGGNGGRGADMNDFYCGILLGTPAGNGGDGGNGGNGGSGGSGGRGGTGGPGGSITVTYPAGFDTANISPDASGGDGGTGGSPGFFGFANYGGRGGGGGYDFYFGMDGQNGFSGLGGFVGGLGSNGHTGSIGTSGSVSITER